MSLTNFSIKTSLENFKSWKTINYSLGSKNRAYWNKQPKYTYCEKGIFRNHFFLSKSTFRVASVSFCIRMYWMEFEESLKSTVTSRKLQLCLEKRDISKYFAFKWRYILSFCIYCLLYFEYNVLYHNKNKLIYGSYSYLLQINFIEERFVRYKIFCAHNQIICLTSI